MDYENLPYEVAPMRVSDIGEVMAIERQSFPTPWSSRAYHYELRFNSSAHYYVVRPRGAPIPAADKEPVGWRAKLRRLLGKSTTPQHHILGYVGFWLAAGEAHISTIAVHPEFRRQGLGQLLLVKVIGEALDQDADFVTLEVRVSNRGAQRLYEKYGFEKKGRRKAYYSDNREDAWIMTVDRLNEPEFQALFRRNKQILHEKLSRTDRPESRENHLSG